MKRLIRRSRLVKAEAGRPGVNAYRLVERRWRSFEDGRAICRCAFIAKRTVTWALGRHKSEKIYERRILAVADLQSSLLKMRRLAGLQFRDTIQEINLTVTYVQQLSDEWRFEESKFQEAAAVAKLFLPNDAVAVVDEVENQFRNVRHEDRFDVWETRLAATERAVGYFEENGRRLVHA